MIERWGLWCCLLVLSCGQGGTPARQDAGRPLARVGGELIGEVEFRTFAEKLPTWQALQEKGPAQVRDYLQTLVDRTLMLREARAQGLQQRPDVAEALEWALALRLAQEVDKREIQSKVSVTDAEVQQRFLDQHWDRQLKVAHIFTRTQERGTRALAALRAGQSFASVAEQLSEDPHSAARGGEMPYYYGRPNATRPVRDALFGLAVGQVSGLVPIPKGFEIFKVLDERKTDFDKVQGKIRKELYRERLVAQGQARFAELSREFGLEPDPQGLGVLVGILRQGPQQGKFYLSPADLERPLYQDQSGVLQLGAAVEKSAAIRQGRGLEDSLRVIEVLKNEVLAPRLLALRARQLKLETDPEIVSWHKKKEEELLLMSLRQQATAKEGAISEEEVRQYYDAHLERYRNPVSTEVVEVQVATEEEARDLLGQFAADRQRVGPLVGVLAEAVKKLPDRVAAGKALTALRSLPVQAGEPEALGWVRSKVAQPSGKGQLLEDLARASSPQELAEEYLFRYLAIEHSQRLESRPVEGYYRLFWYDEARFGKLVEQAMQAKIGALLGPVQVDSLYSLAKVVGRQGAEVRPFAEVARPLRSRLQEERQEQAFTRWADALRQAHRGEVEYLDDNIDAFVRQLQAAGPAKEKGR